jgi:hypothetical protein
MRDLAHTSVPSWAFGADVMTSPDVAGTAHILVGVGPDAAPVLDRWSEELTGELTRVEAPDPAMAAAQLREELAIARVGVRVRITGATGACLALRGIATSAGVEDDELYVAPTGIGPIDLYCVHCGAVTSTEACVDDVVPCAACAKQLVVYHHVSRRSGRFLGFQVDAEEAHDLP